MSRERKNLIALLGVLSVVFITTGVSLAFFSYSRTGTSENSIKSGSITFWYDEQNQSGNSIGITDALPISDTDGKAQTNAFNFKITSNVTDNITVPYEITLRQKSGTDNIGDIVKVYLAKTSGYSATIASEEEVVTSIFDDLRDVTHNGYSEKQLYTTSVPASNTPYEQNYRLKMWVDENADYSDGSLNNKKFTVTVNVYATGNQVSNNANIKSLEVNTNEVIETSTKYYQTSLAEGTTSTTINVEPEDSKATVTVQKTDKTYTNVISQNNGITRLAANNNTFSLNQGYNYFKITVSPEVGEDNIVKLRVEVEKNITVLGQQFKIVPEEPTDKPSEDESGLYESTATNSGNSTYYFRGNVTNNYVDFAGSTWRIMRINEDGTIRLIRENRISGVYGQPSQTSTNLSDMYYSAGTTSGTIKYEFEKWYNENIGNNSNYSKWIADKSGNYFCESAKVAARRYNVQDPYYNLVDGTTFMEKFDTYVPNFRCDRDANGYQYVNTNIGLPTYDELLYAGIPSFKNSHYGSHYFNDNVGFTMSPAGRYEYNGNLYANVWYVNGGTNYLTSSPVSDVSLVLYAPVINIKANSTATYNSETGHIVIQ